jgi:hypothetical protein
MVARTCFMVRVSTYIAATRDTEATFTRMAAGTCWGWEPSTYQDWSLPAVEQIFIALTVDE